MINWIELLLIKIETTAHSLNDLKLFIYFSYASILWKNLIYYGDY